MPCARRGAYNVMGAARGSSALRGGAPRVDRRLRRVPRLRRLGRELPERPRPLAERKRCRRGCVCGSLVLATAASGQRKHTGECGHACHCRFDRQVGQQTKSSHGLGGHGRGPVLLTGERVRPGRTAITKSSRCIPCCGSVLKRYASPLRHCNLHRRRLCDVMTKYRALARDAGHANRAAP